MSIIYSGIFAQLLREDISGNSSLYLTFIFLYLSCIDHNLYQKVTNKQKPYIYHLLFFRTNFTFKYTSTGDISVLTPNVEWDVKSMHGTNYLKEYANSGVYAEVKYIIKIKRRSSFHFINIIFPGMIIAVLVGATFCASSFVWGTYWFLCHKCFN